VVDVTLEAGGHRSERGGGSAARERHRRADADGAFDRRGGVIRAVPGVDGEALTATAFLLPAGCGGVGGLATGRRRGVGRLLARAVVVIAAAGGAEKGEARERGRDAAPSR
jgi:hypothetical protein